MDTDRNLLFGVIALQADLLDATQFAEGCAAWAARKNIALADLLVERGWLTTEDRERVEWLLERKLKKHGGDAGASLAAAITPEAQRVLALWDDPDIQSSLAKLSQEPNSALLSARTVTPIMRDRYTLTALHAKGGIGQVWRAHDAQLGRDIALKELQPNRAQDARLRHYFVTEAQVTGQLEHPGIVPVYELTQPAGDGLPFYTMRFVQGRTLTAATHAYHEKRQAGQAGPLDLRELLDAFVKVCQTVAYAHARGVIHRDLKGQNIVLGDFGAVIVLDWGFAKVLGQSEPDFASPPVAVPAKEAANGTLPGEVLGTPAYMAPEQAEGRLDRIDGRTDVYSLGAILYEILTDQPPFTGADPQDVLRRVREEQPSRPRALRAEVPPALEAVCLKALAKTPNARYPSAGGLGRDVQQWLADEPVTVYREPVAVRLGRWGRRHRAAVVGGAAGLAAAVIFLAVLAGVIEQGRRRSIAEQQRTEEARQVAVAARQKTRAALDEVGSEAINTLLTKQKELTPAHKKFLRTMLGFYEEFAEEKGASPQTRREVADAHVRMGRIRNKLGEYQEAETAYGRARELYAQLAADFPTMPAYRLELASSHNNQGVLLTHTGRSKEAEVAYQDALAIYKELAADFPTVAQYRQDLARSRDNLANLLRRTGRLKEAEAAFQDALTIKKQLAADFLSVPKYREDLATSHNNLAILLVKTGRPKEAETAYRDAIAIGKRLAADFPKEPEYRLALARYQNNLGLLLASTSRPQEAATAYRDTLAILTQLVADFPTVPEYRWELASGHNNLGVLLGHTGRPTEAETPFRDALAIYKRLVADLPSVPEYRMELARGHNNLGGVLKLTGRSQEAEKAYQDALAIQKQLAADFPNVPQYREHLARSRNNLADLLIITGRLQEAEAAHQDALTIQKQLVSDFPKVSDYQNDLAQTMSNLALFCIDRHQLSPARELLEQAATHYQAALKAGPKNSVYRDSYSKNRIALITTLAGLGDHAGAAKIAEELSREPLADAYDAACALSLCVPLVEKDGKLSEGQRKDQAQSYADRAMTMLRQAVANGFTNIADMKKDTDLAPLRKRADFQKLLAELEAKNQGKRP